MLNERYKNTGSQETDSRNTETHYLGLFAAEREHVNTEVTQ